MSRENINLVTARTGKPMKGVPNASCKRPKREKRATGSDARAPRSLLEEMKKGKEQVRPNQYEGSSLRTGKDSTWDGYFGIRSSGKTLDTGESNCEVLIWKCSGVRPSPMKKREKNGAPRTNTIHTSPCAVTALHKGGQT